MQAWVASGALRLLSQPHRGIRSARCFSSTASRTKYCEFDTKALLRSAFKDRIEGLARAVQGGIFSPNEARNSEDLGSVKFGDEPRVQQQVVPLSQIEQTPPAPGPKAPPAAAPAPAAPQPEKVDANAGRDAYARIFLNRSRQFERQQLRRLTWCVDGLPSTPAARRWCCRHRGNASRMDARARAAAGAQPRDDRRAAGRDRQPAARARRRGRRAYGRAQGWRAWPQRQRRLARRAGSSRGTRTRRYLRRARPAWSCGAARRTRRARS